MVQSFFVLSGEHIGLAADEVTSLSKTYDGDASHAMDSNMVIVNSSAPWEKIARRAAFVRLAGTLAGEMSDLHGIKFPPCETFACRVVNLSSKKLDPSHIERETGSVLKTRLNSRVDLSDPMLMIYLIITDSKRYVGYGGRATHRRPRKVAKYPTEIDCKIGRCMVNLSMIDEDQTMCDPFCGTGTILLEAESMGICSIGMDFDLKMCSMARTNLAANGFEPRIVNATYGYVSNISDGISSIVSDLPYGIASRSTAAPKKIIKDLISLVPKKMKMAIIYKKGIEIDELAKAKKYEVYRHKSLTRVIAVR